MAIDQRQIYDLNKLVPNIISDGLDYGDDPGLLITKDEENNEIHIGLVLPTKLDPAYVEPEPEPEPEPVTSDDIGAPTKELKEYHINDIVRFVRAGYGSKFPVGSMIPIKLQNFQLTASWTNRDKRSYGGHGVRAVVLGHDHNIAKENPALEHTMTLALMYRDYGTEEQPMAWASPSEFTGRVISNVDAAFLSALPPEWQDAVVKTTKTGVDAYEGKLQSLTKSIFIPSYYEVYGYQGYIDNQDKTSWEGGAQLQYEYFKKKGFPSNFYYYVGSSVVKNTSTRPFMIASRSPVSKQEGSRMLLQTDAGPRCGFYLYTQGAKTTSYVTTNKYNSPFLNDGWIKQTGNTTAHSIDMDHGSSYDVFAMYSDINIYVGLNQRYLDIGTGTSFIIRDIGNKIYLFTGAGIIPCFNIG